MRVICEGKTKQLLRLAAGEARDLGHSYVGSEHLLLGLVAQQDTISGQVLRSTGLEPAGLRAMTAADYAALDRGRAVAVVLHDLPLRSDTVRLGLQALGEAAGCLFCPGDQPLLRRETVAELAGHEDTSFLERTYCHPQMKLKQEAAEKLEELRGQEQPAFSTDMTMK